MVMSWQCADFHFEVAEEGVMKPEGLAAAMWQRLLELKYSYELSAKMPEVPRGYCLEEAWHQVRYSAADAPTV
jgi:hypothetical protein